MKLWKRWTAAVLAAAMVLLLLAACGPSGPSAPDAPDKPGSSETGKDPADKKTEAQKKAAVVEALNTVRKNNGNNTPLELNEQACTFAKEMAQVQLDGVNGKYGENPSTNRDYIAACANVRKKTVGEKKHRSVLVHCRALTRMRSSSKSGQTRSGKTRQRKRA